MFSRSIDLSVSLGHSSRKGMKSMDSSWLCNTLSSNSRNTSSALSLAMLFTMVLAELVVEISNNKFSVSSPRYVPRCC